VTCELTATPGRGRLSARVEARAVLGEDALAASKPQPACRRGQAFRPPAPGAPERPRACRHHQRTCPPLLLPRRPDIIKRLTQKQLQAIATKNAVVASVPPRPAPASSKIAGILFESPSPPPPPPPAPPPPTPPPPPPPRAWRFKNRLIMTISDPLHVPYVECCGWNPCPLKAAFGSLLSSRSEAATLRRDRPGHRISP